MQVVTQGSWGRAPPPTHGPGELGQSSVTNPRPRGAAAELRHLGTIMGTPLWLTPQAAISPAARRTLSTRWARIAHAALQSTVSAKLGQNSPPLTRSRLPGRQQSPSLPTQDTHPLPSHAYTCCQEPSWSSPYHTVNGFLSNRPEVYYTGLKRERENFINAGAFYSTLRQASMCLYHRWSIKAKERHLQIKDKVMETFFWDTVMEPHCKNTSKKWRFTEHVANMTLHKSNPCTQPSSPSAQSVY